jgi:hypothetical protein
MSEENWGGDQPTGQPGEQQGEASAIPAEGTPEYEQLVQYVQEMQQHYEVNGIPAEGTPEYEQYAQFVATVQAMYAQAGVPEEGTPEYEQYMLQLQQQQLAQEGSGLMSRRSFVADYVPDTSHTNIDDMKVSNLGQRIRVIVGIGVIVVAAIIGLSVFMTSAGDLQAHKDARAAFDAAHKKAILPFWAKARIEIASFKDASDFNMQMLKFVRNSPLKYAKVLKDDALPVLDAAAADYQVIKAPKAYADKLAAVLAAYKGLREETSNFAGQLLMIDSFLEANTKLRRMSDAWFNAQTWEDPQYGVEAFRYYKLLSCLLEGRPIIEINPPDLNAEIAKGCADKKDAWFRRAALECFPVLLAADAQPDAVYNETVAAFRKKGAEKKKAEDGTPIPTIDELSIESISLCATEGQRDFEFALVAKVKAAWDKYEAARKQFLEANTKALGQ